MITARFKDGTACRLETVHGDRFEPREGERFLFEFPEGALKEGTIQFGPVPEASCDNAPRHAIFDRRTKIVALEVQEVRSIHHSGVNESTHEETR